MRLYTNENFYLSAVQALRALGHDVLTSHDAGQSNKSIPDSEVLDFAIETQRILLTLNRRDFIRLHSIQPNHFGLIVCTENSDIQALTQRIDLVLKENPDMERKLVRIVRPH